MAKLPSSPTSVTPRERVWVLANPTAGRGRAAAFAEACVSALRASGHDVRVEYEPADRVAMDDRPDAVVGVGGDGTIRTVAQALLDRFGDDMPPLQVLPMGTANLLGQWLGLPASPLRRGLDLGRNLFLGHNPVDLAADAVLAGVDQGEVVRLDLPTSNGRPFLLMAGAGFDAHVVEMLAARRSGPIRVTDYVRPAVEAVRRLAFPPVSVEVDGRSLWRNKPAVVMVANLPHYGTGIPILPHADPTDGQLDVAVLPCRDHGQLARLLLTSLTGDHLRLERAVVAQGRRVEISSSEAVPVQTDGDPAGRLPMTVELAGRTIPLLRVPGPPRGRGG